MHTDYATAAASTSHSERTRELAHDIRAENAAMDTHPDDGPGQETACPIDEDENDTSAACLLVVTLPLQVLDKKSRSSR
jgi:hypothetical protein